MHETSVFASDASKYWRLAACSSGTVTSCFECFCSLRVDWDIQKKQNLWEKNSFLIAS